MEMGTVSSFLRQQADSILETASRCTDPVISSELREIAEELRTEAEALEAL